MDFMTNLPESMARARAGAQLTEVERLTLIQKQADRITKCEEVIAIMSRNATDMMDMLSRAYLKVEKLEEQLKKFDPSTLRFEGLRS